MLENAMRFYNETMPFKQGVRSSNLRWSTKKTDGHLTVCFQVTGNSK